MTNLDSIFKSRDITLPTKVHLVKAMVFPVVMYGCEDLDREESWALKNWCFWTVVLEKTLESPMDCSTLGLPVHHQLPEFTQTHVHWVGDAIQPSHPVFPFSSCPQSLPASESFPMSQLFAWGGQSTGVSALASFLVKKSQGWSPLEWTGEVQEWNKESSPTPQFKGINCLALSFLHSSTLTSIHDH